MDWIAGAFGELPGCDDDLFKRLWVEGRLKYVGDGSPQPDVVDASNARLVCATLRKQSRTVVLLPDEEPRRAALLLATAVLRHWIDHRDQPIGQSRPVIYFGSEVGIREQLRHVQVVGGARINLGDVFERRDLVRGQSTVSSQKAGVPTDSLLKFRLPEVITAYAPIDPSGLVRGVRPAWVAIDLGDAGHLAWFDSLLGYCRQAGIPAVGWGRNPLSENVAVALGSARVFIWPFKNSYWLGAPDQRTIARALEPVRRTFEPLILAGAGAETLASHLEPSARGLASLRAGPSESLLADTLSLHWQWLRSIEAISVPTDLYEAEAERTWGLKSITRLESSSERFRDAARASYASSAQQLTNVGCALSAASQWLKGNEPPLWIALCNLCLETQPTGTAKLIVFPSYARKRLFQLALLARYNISDEDLRDLRVLVTSLKELRSRAMSPLDSGLMRSLSVRPLVVGLPSWRASYMMDCVMEYDYVQYLLLSHQAGGLMRRSHVWSDLVAPDVGSAARAIGDLLGREAPLVQGHSTAPIRVETLTELEVSTLRRRPAERVQGLLALGATTEEVAALFEPGTDDDADAAAFSEHTEAADSGTDSSSAVWCDSAILVEFEQDWVGLFAADDMLNIVMPSKGGLTTQERFVRSVREGDRVLLVHGSRRQNLYDLIVERVHRHPAIELHLALLRRWRDDFKDAIHRWRPRTLDDLLRELIKKGSRLTSAGTLYHWLRGWTLCPQDPADILRAADVMGMAFLQKNHNAVARAAKRVRGLHISLSSRLGRWLTESPQAAQTGAGDDVIDAELGLTFNDFRSSIVVVVVERIAQQAGPFLRSRLGRVTQRAQ